MKFEKFKILFVTPNLNPGGSQKLIVNLLNNIENKDKYLLIYKKKECFLKRNITSKVDIIFSKSRRILLSFFEINKIIKEKNINCIFSSMRNMNIILGLYCYFFTLKTKLVLHEPNTMDEFKDMSFRKFIKINLMKLSYANSNFIIANSKDTKNDLLKYRIINRKKIKVVSNPISVSEKKMDNLEKIKKFKKKKFTVVGCGALTDQKNFELLVNAFSIFKKKIKKTCLVIIGDGFLREKIKRRIERLGLKKDVLITGFVKNPYKIFKISNMFVLSSRYEGFGNVLVEAVFAKMKIISTNCKGGPKDILKNGKYGYLARNDNQNDLADKMLKCYKKPKKINYDYFFEKYSSKNISKKYLKIFMSK